MKTLLDTIAQSKHKEIAALKQTYSHADFERMEGFSLPTRSLSASIRSRGFGVIAEFKRQSPSAGIINGEANPIDQMRLYEKAGAAAISCLTDAPFFGGTLDDLFAIKTHGSLPVLRKDFILDELQIFEARAYGADAILLISELLEPEHAAQLTIIAQSLDMEVLMEAHDLKHLARIPDNVTMIGINNRDLHLQKTTLQTSFDLFDFIPKDKLCISESGIRTKLELTQLEKTGYHGALIGESLMTSEAPSNLLGGRKAAVPCS